MYLFKSSVPTRFGFSQARPWESSLPTGNKDLASEPPGARCFSPPPLLFLGSSGLQQNVTYLPFSRIPDICHPPSKTKCQYNCPFQIGWQFESYCQTSPHVEKATEFSLRSSSASRQWGLQFRKTQGYQLCLTKGHADSRRAAGIFQFPTK